MVASGLQNRKEGGNVGFCFLLVPPWELLHLSEPLFSKMKRWRHCTTTLAGAAWLQ